MPIQITSRSRPDHSPLPAMTRNRPQGWQYAWVAPLSVIGLAFGAIALPLGAKFKVHDGILEVALRGHSKRPPFPMPHRKLTWLWQLQGTSFVAITLGHVVIGRDPDTLCDWRAHEQVHVRQMERWGLLFPVLYAGASTLALLKGRHLYWDNHFEVEARRCAAMDN